MSESFQLKIKFGSADKPALECIGRLVTALDEEDYGAVAQIAAAALDGRDGNQDSAQGLAQVAPLLLPCSEYGPAQVPVLQALCGALEDACASIYRTGTGKSGIQLNGTDNGTADAAAYLLAWLQALPVEVASAQGKGFTWMARWEPDGQGVLRVAAYEPLEEGHKIDPKADEKLWRKAERENKAFLQSPLRSLVQALPAGDDPIALVRSVGHDGWLGHGFADLMDRIATEPDRSALNYRIGLQGQPLNAQTPKDELAINTWNQTNGKQVLELDLYALLPIDAMNNHFLQQLPHEANILPNMFRWHSGGVQVFAKLYDDQFRLQLERITA